MSRADGPEERAFETQERADAAAERERIAQLNADDFLDALVEIMRPSLIGVSDGMPYPWCADRNKAPEKRACYGKGYCPKDPNCGD